MPAERRRVRRDRWRSHGPIATAVVALLVVAAACGGSRSEPIADALPVQPAAPVGNTAPTTTIAATSSTNRNRTATTSSNTTTSTTATTTTTTTASTTTSSTTTTTAPLPLPVDPPSDPNADEPVVEVGRITIPKIGVDMAIFEGIRLSTLDHGPGHWPGTAMPGEIGNVVIAGHRVSKHQVFRHVDQLVGGDEIVITDADGRHRYVVSQVQVVDPDAIWIVDQTPTATATLFACHPPGSTRQRIVVFADLVDE